MFRVLSLVNHCYGDILEIYIPSIVLSPTANIYAIADEIIPIVNHTKTNVVLSIILFTVFIIIVFRVNKSIISPLYLFSLCYLIKTQTLFKSCI